MKKIVCIVITALLIISTAGTAYAHGSSNGKKNSYSIFYPAYEQSSTKDYQQGFSYSKSPVIKYTKYYRVPVVPITKGMGGDVSYNKKSAKLKVDKGTITIEINFKKKTVTVNGKKDKKSGIFTAKNDDKMEALLAYIAKILGVDCSFEDGKIIIERPGLSVPSGITVTSIGSQAPANTINGNTLYIEASARIKAGQATGGKAELYVGNTLVAADTVINANDTKVTFSTSASPVNAYLQAVIPKGGQVTVKLYNSSNQSVTSSKGPTLVVDYIAPAVGSISSATYDSAKGRIRINVGGASAAGDQVDVTKLSLTDTNGRTFQLTNNSSGVISNTGLIEITLGAVDRHNLSSYGTAPVYLTILPGSLLKDAAGNVSASAANAVSLVLSGTSGPTPTPVPTVLTAPSKVTVTPVGTNVVSNALNATTVYMLAQASITAGQATGGRAELYVGSKLVAVDSYIEAADTTVTFTTADSSPSNEDLRTIIPTGGVVTVRLYNAYNNSAISVSDNPTLVVDYEAPRLDSNSLTIAFYDVSENEIYFPANNITAVGDKVDVTKLSFFAANSTQSYQLSDAASIGSSGTVTTGGITVKLGLLDRYNLAELISKAGTNTSGITMYVSIASGALISDAAGNTSAPLAAGPSLQVIVSP